MSKMRPEVAKRRIKSFEKRFGKAHLYLAYHAAFPLSLTPDLLYRLWANFQRDIHGQVLSIPWIAVADLLLSSLCDEVGRELYEMDLAVRNVLLSRLKEDEKFGQQRIHELSDFLLEYVRQQLLSDDPDVYDFAQTQQWLALAYTQPSEAARELALAFSKVDEKDTAELVRMASLTETFTEPLKDFQALLIYAQGMENFARGNLEDAKAQLGEVLQRGNQIKVAGVNLPVPEQINANPQNNPSVSTSTFANKFCWLIRASFAATLIIGVGTVAWWQLNPIRFQQPLYSLLKREQKLSAADTQWIQNLYISNIFSGHSRAVKSVAISPDAKIIVSGDEAGIIKLWSVGDGKLLFTLTAHSNYVNSVAFSADGKTFASGSADRTIKLWNLDGKLLGELTGHLAPVTSVAFSPDGRTLASGSADRTIKFWSLNGKLLRTLEEGSSTVTSVAFSSDGRTLASGTRSVTTVFENGTIAIWNLGTGERIKTLRGHSSGITSVFFGPDSQTLASGSFDSTIRIWNLSTGEHLRTLRPEAWVYSVAISPNGQILVSGSNDQTVRIWNLETKQVLRELRQTGVVYSVAISSDGRTLVSSSGVEVMVLKSKASMESGDKN